MHSVPAQRIALGGILAAIAVIIMSLGGLIPVATYVCPVFCSLLVQLVYRLCGRSIAWAWYGAVCILSMLLSPDKEAAATFLFLGYYPIVKPRLDKYKIGLILKVLFFNCSILVMYWLLLKILGLHELSEEFQEMNSWMMMLLLILGNIAFILLDKLLNMDFFRKLGINGK